MTCCTLLGSYCLEGEFIDGKPHGFCRWFWDDGLLYIGKIYNGVFEGQGEIINGAPYSNTKIIGTFQKGKLILKESLIEKFELNNNMEKE